MPRNILFSRFGHKLTSLQNGHIKNTAIIYMIVSVKGKTRSTSIND